MIRRPPISTRTDTLFPYTTLFRSLRAFLGSGKRCSMPRSPDGSYSLPAGTLVSSGDTILVSQHNPAMQDIASALGKSLDRDGTGGMRSDRKSTRLNSSH